MQPSPPEKAVVWLTSCLALSAPTGMNEDDRSEWVTVAQATVGHYPPDILEEACREARMRADHPAKIVPLIVKHAEPLVARRWADLRDLQEREAPLEIEGPKAPKEWYEGLGKALGTGQVDEFIEKIEKEA